MAVKDYYKILGVDKNADASTIKKKYHELAKKYHPDKTGGKTAAQFAEINEAYEVLSDQKKRAKYDSGGDNLFEDMGGFGGFQNQGQYSGGGFQNFNFEDLFDFFGSSGHSSQAQQRNTAIKGEDIITHTNITLEEAFRGLKINFKYERKEQCNACTKNCTECNGTGTKVSTISSGFSIQHTYSKCRKCGGKGKENLSTCRGCKGFGFMTVSKNLDMIIPPGVEDQQVITYKDMGHGGINGGEYGHLNLFIKIQKHAIFERIGSDLRLEKNLLLSDLLGGCEFFLDGIDGEKIRVKVKPGTQFGEEMKLIEKGMKRYNSFLRGNLIIKFFAKIPSIININDQQDLMKIFKKY